MIVMMNVKIKVDIKNKIRTQNKAHAGENKTTKHLACVSGMPWPTTANHGVVSCRVSSVRLCGLHMHHRLARSSFGREISKAKAVGAWFHVRGVNHAPWEGAEE